MLTNTQISRLQQEEADYIQYDSPDGENKTEKTHSQEAINEFAHNTLTNSMMLTSPAEESLAGIQTKKLDNVVNYFDLPQIWQSALKGDWDSVNAQLKDASLADVEASPKKGPHKGVTLLLMAASWEQWEIVNSILELNPRVNLDAFPAKGPDRGITLLWLAAYYTQWSLVEKILKLNPRINLEASRVEGPDRDLTILCVAANYEQWDLVKTIIALNPKVNLDSSPAEGSNRGLTTLWFAAWFDQWDLVKTIIELNPKVNLDVSPVIGKNKDKKIIDFVLDSKEIDNQDLSTVISYLILLGVNGRKDHLKWQEKKTSIFSTFDRVVTGFYDLWNNPSGKPFQEFSIEIIVKIVEELIHEELPELDSFPQSLLFEKIIDRANVMYEVNHALALKNIALLTFNEFLLQNQSDVDPYQNSEKEDTYNLIVSCLQEFEIEYKGTQFTYEKRMKIANELAKNLKIDFPPKRSSIINAIKKIMINE